MRWFLALIILFCVSAPVRAEWVLVGDGQYLWRDALGKFDGVLYGWSYSYGKAYSYPVRNLSADELSQFNQQPQAQQQSQQQYQYNQEPDVGWRTQLLKLAATQQEQRQYLAAIDALGLRGGYGVESASGTNVSQIMAGQYGMKNPGIFIGDLPLQQGNTVYGYENNSYNQLADPFRNFDIGSTISSLIQLSGQVEQGSTRVRSDTAQTIQQSLESYRLIRETESRIQGTAEIIRLLTESWQANKAQTFRIETGSDGRPKIQVVPEGGGPPSGPPGGGPPGGPPNGAPLGAPKAGGGDEYSALVSIINKRCLQCHGGDKTSETSGKLIFGKGGTVNLQSLNETQAAKVGKRVAEGSMPPGGALPEDEQAIFKAFFGPK